MTPLEKANKLAAYIEPIDKSVEVRIPKQFMPAVIRNADYTCLFIVKDDFIYWTIPGDMGKLKLDDDILKWTLESLEQDALQKARHYIADNFTRVAEMLVNGEIK